MNKNFIDPRVYLAAERTFLAWIRTAVAFLAFGVAIEKFDFFIKNIALTYKFQFKGFSEIYHLGKILIFIGIITLLLGKINFYNTLIKIEQKQYITSKKLYLFYTILITLIALGLLLSFFFI